MARRGSGEGTIRQRPDGRWEARTFANHADGRRVRSSVYGATKADVQAKLRRLLNEQERGGVVASRRATVETFLTTWLEDFAKPALRPRTFEGYRDHVIRNIVPVLGHKPLQKLTGQDIQRLINAKTKSGHAPATVRYMFAVLRSALRRALKLGLIANDPTVAVVLPRRERHATRFLAPEEAKALLTACSDHRLGALFSVALAVGLRIGEAMALRWSDVDLAAESLTVRRTLHRTKAGIVYGEPKSFTSRRTLDVPEFAIEALKHHRVLQSGERLKAGKGWQEQGLVFTTPIGTALDYSNCRRDFRSLLATAGLPMMRIHDLRHTCASLLVAQGVHLKVIQELLGHSQITLTADTYSHVGPAVRSEAANRLQALLG